MIEPTLWRYSIPNQNNEGWAIFVIGSDGYFSAVSDYGNYAYIWRCTGRDDFREFLLSAERDWDYFARKLAPERVYDEESTANSIRKAILEQRADKHLTKEVAREEWELFSRSSFESEFDFHEWLLNTELEDAGWLACYETNGDAVQFVRNCMVRLIPLLKADLEKEKSCQSEPK